MFKVPTIENILHDSKRGVWYNVVAFRKLKPVEIEIAVDAYLKLEKLKPKKGTTTTIITSIGSTRGE